MIHPTAIVSPRAELGANISVGPYAIIGDDVVIHDAVEIGGHVVIEGPTEIGTGTCLFPFAYIGQVPQDLKFKGERTRLVVGARNTIREYVTLHRGTAGGGGLTSIGNDNLFMAQAHVAHDCIIGSHNIFANCASLGGHVATWRAAALRNQSLPTKRATLGKLASSASMQPFITVFR